MRRNYKALQNYQTYNQYKIDIYKRQNILQNGILMKANNVLKYYAQNQLFVI